MMPLLAKLGHKSSASKSSGPSASRSGHTAAKMVLPTCKHALDTTRWQKRLQKELMSLLKEPPPGMTLDVDAEDTKLTE
ncbi:uncharacterized protein LOC125178160 [Hyalella azteca]|uniref:Uncharacterized protein LOC125178160 n=1 Tax=Hyalella azteca TaxID=294128 RepID=A0A979FL45_HYAAZ|nr:uncharacterized protein LOC125178160 [Hyalella azteca]